ncbi:hypothetical protein [Prevotella pallens]|uniref:hypothetical protein n=1 Tax=Prevotella pallens TaxID=60133 RepID=UPI001CB0DCDE|nr:hypothetical protein [Prevotella pallens]MBF1471847.1 hypothetical protein [Prevotella pallens]
MYLKKKDIFKIVSTLLLMYFTVLIMSYTDTVSWGLWKRIPFHLGMVFIVIFDRIQNKMLFPDENKK